MDLFREVRLSLACEEDFKAAIDILAGRITVSQAAEARGQEHWSFDGEGDILRLSFARDTPDSTCKRELAERVLGDRADELVRKSLIPAIVESNVALELVLQECNLSQSTVIALADAFRANTSFVGFNVSGNPGNTDIGDAALKRACVETMAPIQWFQGRFIESAISEARQQLARKRIQSTMNNITMSPRSKVATLIRIHRSNPSTEENSILDRRKSRKHMSERPEEGNEREKWHAEIRTKLRSSGSYTEEDMNQIIVDLELEKLQETIDRLITDTENSVSRNGSPIRISSSRPVQYMTELSA